MTALATTRGAQDVSALASGRGFDDVRIVPAAILLAGAGLKAHQLATEPVAGRDIFSCRWPLMAQVEFEIVLGVWLLSGLFRRLAWAATLDRENPAISVALVELEPTRAERTAAERSPSGSCNFSARRPWVDGLLAVTKEWFLTTLAVVLLKDARVRGGWEGKARKMKRLMKVLVGSETDPAAVRATQTWGAGT